jgi:co-chaperonin GroES (HSP10)
MKAIGNYVLVKMNKVNNVTKGGIILTENPNDAFSGVVESIGSKAYISNKDCENLVGKTVLFDGSIGARNIPFKNEDGEEYMITDFFNIMVVT